MKVTADVREVRDALSEAEASGELLTEFTQVRGRTVFVASGAVAYLKDAPTPAPPRVV